MKTLRLLFATALFFVSMTTVFAQKRTYDVGSFNRIDVSCVADIHFTQGSNTSVKAESKNGNLDNLVVKNKKGCLVIDHKYKDGSMSSGKSKDVRYDLYITSPELVGLDVAGVTTFHAASIVSPSFNLNVAGVGKIYIDNLKSDKVNIVFSGVSTFEGKVESKSFAMDNSGSSKINADINGGDAKIENAGSSNVDLKFKGGSLSIENSGAPIVVADIDCKELKVDNSGSAKLTLKGTADDTKIENSGVSKIDTSELNKY